MNRPRKKNPELPACVHPKHGAYYYVKGGKWKRLPKKGPSTLTTALEAYAAIVDAPRGGMDTLIDEALENMEGRISANTYKQYKGAATKLKSMLAEFAPDQVKGKHAAGIKRGLKKTPNMANRVLSFARQVFDYALEEEVPGVDDNPFASVRRHQEKKRSRLISDQEYALIRAQSPPRLQCINDIQRLTGQRIMAVVKIKRVDLTEEGIRFPAFKTETKRIVKWSPELREAVDRAKRLNGNIVALTLFVSRHGKPPAYQTVKDQWDRACKAAGVEDAKPNDLRAVAATKAKGQGKSAKDLLGHTTEANTQRYLRGREEPIVEGPSFRQSNRHHKNS